METELKNLALSTLGGEDFEDFADAAPGATQPCSNASWWLRSWWRLPWSSLHFYCLWRFTFAHVDSNDITCRFYRRRAFAAANATPPADFVIELACGLLPQI